MYPVVEIFNSVQGEGIHLGRPVTFIRLSGCNCKCPWCDTDHSKFKPMPVEEIVQEVRYSRIVVTGGEPTIHDLTPLLERLQGPHNVVCLETNGTNSLMKYGGLLQWVSCSPKPPVYPIHPFNLKIIDELKYVVDEQFSLEVLPDIGMLPDNVRYIWLQPEANNFEESVKKAYALVMKNPALRLGMQAHKVWRVE